jgi:hypothetical protein
MSAAETKTVSTPRRRDAKNKIFPFRTSSAQVPLFPPFAPLRTGEKDKKRCGLAVIKGNNIFSFLVALASWCLDISKNLSGYLPGGVDP